jgi:signal transduction histidine kinase
MMMLLDYNSYMKEIRPHADVLRLIRFAAFLWIGYLIALTLINQAFPPPHPSPPPPSAPQYIDFLYYIVQGFVALICLALAYWPWIQERLRQAFVPLIIAIITVIPFIVHLLMIRFFPFSPQFSREGPILTLLPFVFVGLLLVAWQYRWQYTLFIILGIAGLNLGLLWSFSAPNMPPFQGGLVVTLTQAVIFLALGFSISYLMSRLRQQQQSLEAANIRLTHYASTLEHLATSQERNRVARELHDTLAHTLSGLSVQLETVKAYWDVDQQAARSILDKSLAAARSGLDETRRALKALRASPLDDLGLALAIRNMVEEAAVRSNLTLDLSITDNMPALSPDVEQCIYRVAQEAVANVVNHANASNLAVMLEFLEEKVTLTVRDDGVGFDTEKHNGSSHFGLVGMRERTELVGGELKIVSKPGNGTLIQLTI